MPAGDPLPIPPLVRAQMERQEAMAEGWRRALGESQEFSRIVTLLEAIERRLENLERTSRGSS